MAGGGGALPEPGFLDVPTFTLAAVLACFLLVSLVFERVRGWAAPAVLPSRFHPSSAAPTRCSNPPHPCLPSAAPPLQSTHWLIRFLKKRKRNGLAQAVSNLITELTLVGFIALLLTVLQGPISNICVSYQPDSYDLWTLIRCVRQRAGRLQLACCSPAARLLPRAPLLRMASSFLFFSLPPSLQQRGWVRLLPERHRHRGRLLPSGPAVRARLLQL